MLRLNLELINYMLFFTHHVAIKNVSYNQIESDHLNAIVIQSRL